MRDRLAAVWRLLGTEHGWSRVWVSLGMAITMAGGGLIYYQTTQDGDGGQSCPAYPSFPDAACTGVPSGTSLTTHSGDLTVTQAGSTVDAMDVSGAIFVDANNVTIKRSSASYLVMRFGVTGTVIQDTEIDGGGGGGNCVSADTGAGGGGDPAHDFTALRVDIQGCEDAFKVSTNYTVTDSYIHNLSSGATYHNDGFQIFGGDDGTVIHNWMASRDTSVMQYPQGGGTVSNVLIKHNYFYLAPGGAYDIYCPVDTATNFQVIYNAFDESGDNDFSTECGGDGEITYGNYRYVAGTNLALGGIEEPLACVLPAFPDAACTGVPTGVALTASGGMTISSAGTVINGLDITGQVNVNAANVIIKNSKIHADTFTVIQNNSTGLIIQDSEIYNQPGGTYNCHNGVQDNNLTLLRVEISQCENAVNVDGDNVTVKDSYFHDLDTVGPSWQWGDDPHTDGMQIGEASSYVNVLHTVVDPVGAVVGVGATSAIIMYTGTGTPNDNVTIEDNYLDGRNSAYALYANREAATNIYINDNKMYSGGAGYTDCVLVGVTVTQFNNNRDAGTNDLIAADEGAGSACED